MKVDFYYWSYQCPLNNSMIELLREYEGVLDISYHDISKDFMLAQKMEMFFPTLTVINNKYRYFSPLKRTFLDSLCLGTLPKEDPYISVQGTLERNGRIEAINKSNLLIASTCTGKNCIMNCDKKAEFLDFQKLLLSGFINIDENNCLLGGAEYMPSLLVPYKIPKDDKTAFLTCAYLSDNKFDYKSGPLKVLEKHLSYNYNRIIVISDEVGVFPNGNLEFFIRNSYKDIGVISKEAEYCTLHLLSKDI